MRLDMPHTQGVYRENWESVRATIDMEQKEDIHDFLPVFGWEQGKQVVLT